MKAGLYGKSWADLFNNIRLLIPDAIYLIISSVLVLAFLYISGFATFILESYKLENIFELLISFIGDNAFKIIVALIGFIIANFFVGVGKDALKYGMISNLLSEKDSSLKTAWKNKGNHYMQIIGLKLRIFLIYLALAAVFGILIGLFGIEDGSFKWAGIITINTLLFLAIIVISVALIFRYPIMFLNKYGAGKTIRESFKLFKERYWRFLLTVAVLIITIGGISLLISFIPGLGVVGFMFNIFANLILTVWKDLYIFNAYKIT